MAVCPYKGLARFEASDAEFFFGRERLVAELVTHLVGAGLVGVVGGELVRAAAGTMGPVGQALQTTGRIPIHPGVQALAGDAPPLGHLGHCPPVTNHLHDGVIALLDRSVLPEHPPHPPRPGRPERQRPGKAERSVKDQPKPRQASAEPLSSISRSRNVKDQPQPHSLDSP
jgi:hypothetical protein